MVNITSIIITGHRGVQQIVKLPISDSHYNSPLYRTTPAHIFAGDPSVPGDGLDYVLNQLEIGTAYSFFIEIKDVVSDAIFFSEDLIIKNTGTLIEWNNSFLAGTSNNWNEFYEVNFMDSGGPIWDQFPPQFFNDAGANPNFYRLTLKIILA